MSKWVGREPGRMSAFLGSHEKGKISEHPFYCSITMGTICCAGHDTENNMHGAVLRFRVDRVKEFTFYTVEPELLPELNGIADVLHWLVTQLEPGELHTLLSGIYECGMNTGRQNKMDEIREALGV